MVFYDLEPLFGHKILPKKVGKVYEEFGIKISFGQPFKQEKDGSLSAPSWIDMSLNRIVEIEEQAK